MSTILYTGEIMAYEEKSAWVYGILAIITYGIYAAVILVRAQSVPITEVDYVGPLLVTIGGSIVLGIIVGIVVGILSGRDGHKKDQRDRQIARFGDLTGQSFLVIGSLGALLMALAEWPYFWIANVLYLAFVLSAILGSIAKIAAYRRGLPEW